MTGDALFGTSGRVHPDDLPVPADLEALTEWQAHITECESWPADLVDDRLCGRRVWARPGDVPSTTRPRWCVVRRVRWQRGPWPLVLDLEDVDGWGRFDWTAPHQVAVIREAA